MNGIIKEFIYFSADSQSEKLFHHFDGLNTETFENGRLLYQYVIEYKNIWRNQNHCANKTSLNSKNCLLIVNKFK